MADSLENQYDNEKFIDYYEILNVDIEATVDVIKKNYIELAKKYHPDQKNGNVEMFQLVTKAYEVLINKDTRKEYDLYFLKQNFNELQEENFYSLKDQFKEFITANDNKDKLTKCELDKIYQDAFKDREELKDTALDKTETLKRINDINFEREAMNIESNDEQLKKIIENNPNIDINEVLEYMKETNKNNFTEIINTDDHNNGFITELDYFDCNYSYFNDPNTFLANNYYAKIDTNVESSKEQLKNFDINNFNNWKYNKKSDTRLDTNDIEKFLANRKKEEQTLLNEVENSIVSNIKKRN
jgi:curved DNA-binding protein CbpA